MRILAITILTIFQFTALPFLSILAANTQRQEERSVVQVTQNVTTIYKSVSM